MYIEQMLSVIEVADYLGVSRSTIYSMEKKGLLSAKSSSSLPKLFSKADIESYLAETHPFETPQKLDNSSGSSPHIQEKALKYDTEPTEPCELFLQKNHSGYIMLIF